MSARDLAGSPTCTASTGAEIRVPSLAALYRQEFAFVWRTLRYLGVPPASVEDAAQEVFIVAQRRLSSFEPARASIRSWLFGIARNTARHHHRAAKRRDPSRLGPAQEQTADPSSNPEVRIAQAEAIALVERGLAKLSPERREVFVLCEIEGLSAPAVAELLNLNVNTVYSRLARARSRFRATTARHLAQERGLHG